MKITDATLNQIRGFDEGYQKTTEIFNQPATVIERLLSNIIGFLTVIAGLAFLIYLVLAGFTWITARDDSGRMDRAKQMASNALVGLAIVVVSWAFAGVMQTVFGLKILNPAEMIQKFIPK